MINLHQSLALAGPVDFFGIQSSGISGKNHPRIWIQSYSASSILPVLTLDFANLSETNWLRLKGTGLLVRKMLLS